MILIVIGLRKHVPVTIVQDNFLVRWLNVSDKFWQAVSYFDLQNVIVIEWLCIAKSNEHFEFFLRVVQIKIDWIDIDR